MLRERIITGIIAIPIITAVVFYSPEILSLFTWIIIMLGMMEYHKIENLPLKIDFVISCIFSLGLCFFALKNKLLYFHIAFILLIAALFGAWIYKNMTSSKSFLLTVLGNIYITYFFSYVLFLRNIPGLGSRYVFFIFLLVWVTDTSAYFIGVNFGSHKLAPNISPKKTIEGAAAGLIGAILITMLAKITFLRVFSFGQCFIIGILFSIIAQMGDLFESMLKRKAQIKDSGTLIPGHGGVLDRFDSLFFTIPSFYYYVKLVLEK